MTLFGDLPQRTTTTTTIQTSTKNGTTKMKDIQNAVYLSFNQKPTNRDENTTDFTRQTFVQSINQSIDQLFSIRLITKETNSSQQSLLTDQTPIAVSHI